MSSTIEGNVIIHSDTEDSFEVIEHVTDAESCTEMQGIDESVSTQQEAAGVVPKDKEEKSEEKKEDVNEPTTTKKQYFHETIWHMDAFCQIYVRCFGPQGRPAEEVLNIAQTLVVLLSVIALVTSDNIFAQAESIILGALGSSIFEVWYFRDREDDDPEEKSARRRRFWKELRYRKQALLLVSLHLFFTTSSAMCRFAVLAAYTITLLCTYAEKEETVPECARKWRTLVQKIDADITSDLRSTANDIIDVMLCISQTVGGSRIFEFVKSKFSSKQYLVKRGEEVEVQLGSLKLGKHDTLRVVVKSPIRNSSPDQLPTEVKSTLRKSGSNYAISFTPIDVGAYKVLAYVNEVQHYLSPIAIRVYDASEIVVADIPPQAYLNDKVEFTVDAGRAGYGTLEMSIKNADGVIISSHVDKLESGPSKFRITFSPTTKGSHTVNIHFNKEILRDSPFEVAVIDAPVAQKRE